MRSAVCNAALSEDRARFEVDVASALENKVVGRKILHVGGRFLDDGITPAEILQHRRAE